MGINKLVTSCSIIVMHLQHYKPEQTAVEVTHAGVKDFVLAYNLSLFNPILAVPVLFIGAMMCFVFVAMAMKAVRT